jgi:hypothetical protein
VSGVLVLSPRIIRDAVKGTCCLGAGIGTHEVVAGHITAGEMRGLMEKLVSGGLAIVFRGCLM